MQRDSSLIKNISEDDWKDIIADWKMQEAEEARAEEARHFRFNLTCITNLHKMKLVEKKRKKLIHFVKTNDLGLTRSNGSDLVNGFIFFQPSTSCIDSHINKKRKFNSK